MSDDVVHKMLGDAQRELAEFKAGMVKLAEERDRWKAKAETAAASTAQESAGGDRILALHTILSTALALVNSLLPYREALESAEIDVAATEAQDDAEV